MNTLKSDNRSFYRHVAAVAIPIVIQTFITNFVSLLDNIMVGRVGTTAMSGVAIVNQLLLVFNLCIYGAVSGAGIFTAQFFGSNDQKGIAYTLRFKILSGLVLAVLGIALFLAAGKPLIGLYLQGTAEVQDAEKTLSEGLAYLRIMLIGMIPFALTNAYSGTLRETQQTAVPMNAGISAVGINLCLNFVLIFGLFGLPAMGVRGAAIATVVARFAECFIVILWTHTHPKKAPYIKGALSSFYIPGNLLKQIFLKGTPLMLNECFWSMGVAFLNQCYSTRGLDAVAAINISGTIFNLGSVVFISMGNVASIIIGQLLGANKPEKTVRDAFKKVTALSVFTCVGLGIVLILTSGLFPRIYNTTESVRSLATWLICINALFMPFNAYVHSVYFTMRSGGQTIITFIFDSGFMWVCSAPLAYCISRFTGLPLLPLYALCQSLELIKSAFGAYLIRGNKWIKNLTVLPE